MKHDKEYQEKFEGVVQEVRDKLDFGLMKYGDKSFQSSKENLQNCDTLQHLREELVDIINYGVAAIIKIDNIKKQLDLGTSKWNGSGYDKKDKRELL